MNVKIVQTNFGPQILCDFDPETNTLMNPVELFPSGPGQCHMVQFMAYAEGVISLKDDGIAFVTDPVPEMIAEYERSLEEMAKREVKLEVVQ